MRNIIIILAVVLVGAMVTSMTLGKRSPGVTVHSANNASGWDLERRCFRQQAWDYTETDGVSVSLGLTVFGNCKTILEPWLLVTPGSGSLDLRDSLGGGKRLPLEASCAWLTTSGSWVHVTTPIPDLQPVADQLRANPELRLFPALQAEFPELRTLWTRIEAATAGDQP